MSATVEITCTYCGYMEERVIFSQSQLEGARCGKCGDKNLKFKNPSESKLDTYSGSPPFKKDPTAKDLKELKEKIEQETDDGLPWRIQWGSDSGGD